MEILTDSTTEKEQKGTILKIKKVDNSNKEKGKIKKAVVNGLGLLGCWAGSLVAGAGIGASAVVIATGVLATPLMSIAAGGLGVIAFYSATAWFVKQSMKLAMNIKDSFDKNDIQYKETPKTLSKK